MRTADIERESVQPAPRDLRGILVACATALAMWVFIIIGVLGFVLKVLSAR